MDFDGVTSLVSQNKLIVGAIPTLQDHVIPMAYVILCLRFTLVVRLL